MLWSTPGGGGGPAGGPSSGLLADWDRLVEGRRPRTDAAAVSGTVACLPDREGVNANELRLRFSNTTRNVCWGEVDGGTHVRQAAWARNAPNLFPNMRPTTASQDPYVKMPRRRWASLATTRCRIAASRSWMTSLPSETVLAR